MFLDACCEPGPMNVLRSVAPASGRFGRLSGTGFGSPIGPREPDLFAQHVTPIARAASGELLLDGLHGIWRVC